MKKWIRLLTPLLIVAMFAGCNVENDINDPSLNSRPGYWDDQLLQNSTTTPSGPIVDIQIPTISTSPSTNSTKPTTRPSTKPTTKPSTHPSTLPPLPPVTQPGDIASKLQFTQYGRFSGQYMEDGKDEYVQGVVALYVTNVSDEYLEYANVKCDVNGQEANFVVTGLKPNTSAWVLERNRLVIDEENVNNITMTHLSDQSSFKDDTEETTQDVIVKLQSGHLTAYNNTGRDLKSVYVYYKKQFTSVEGDYLHGIFLGGITYRVLLGDIKNGDTAQAIAGHCAPQGCEVVRVEWAQ